MDNLKYWRMCEEYTVIEAAFLICDEDPNTFYADQIAGLDATTTALKRAIFSGKLKAKIKHKARTNKFHKSAEGFFEHQEHDDEPSISDQVEPDWYQTTIQGDDIKEWLRGLRHTDNFFFQDENPKTNQEGPDYLDPSHACYAHKLAAAIKAWHAVTSDPALRRGRSAKQAMEKWLINNAEELGLINKDGSINKSGIEDAAKIANWEQKGGAPKQTSI